MPPLSSTMNINFGLFPPLATKLKRKDRKAAVTHRALDELETWLGARAAAE